MLLGNLVLCFNYQIQNNILKIRLFIEGHGIITNIRLLDVQINISEGYYDKFLHSKI